MSKLRKSIFIFGILILCVAVALVTFLALSETGFISSDPIAITVRVRSVTEPYDAGPHTASNFDIVEGELLNGHNIEALSYTGTQVNVGDCESNMTLRVVDENSRDVSGQYSIRVVPGTVTVTRRTITVNQQDVTADYSGEPVINDKFTVVEENGLCEGHRLVPAPDEGVTKPTMRPVRGDSAPMIYDAAGNNVTANYDMTFTSGTVTVRKRLITIAPVSVERMYDGTPLEPESYSIISGSLMPGHEIASVSWEFEGEDGATSITDVGSMRVRVRGINLRDEDADDYYTVMSTTATVTVTPRPIVIEGKSKTWQYVPKSRRTGEIGENLGIGKNEIVSDELAEDYGYYTLRDDKTPANEVALMGDDKLTVEYGASIDEVGEKPNTYTYVVTRRTEEADGETEEDVTRNYLVTALTGTLRVERRALTVNCSILEPITAVYNGKEHTVDLPDDFTTGIRTSLATVGLMPSDFLTVSDRPIKNVGDYEFGLEFADDTLAKNYDLKSIAGKYTVTKAALPNFTYGADDMISKIYDGKPAEIDCALVEFTRTAADIANKIPEIYLAAAALSVEDTDYYKCANKEGEVYSGRIVNAVIRDKETGENVTANYNLTNVPINVEIRKRTVTVGAKPLSVSTTTDISNLAEENADTVLALLEITSGSLADGDKIVVADGGRLQAEEGDGTYTVTGFTITNADNYDFVATATGIFSRISGGGLIEA